MSEEQQQHTIEVVVEPAPTAAPKGEAAAPAKDAKPTMADLAAKTRAQVAERKAAAAARKAAEPKPEAEPEPGELERLRADAEAHEREIRELRAELAQAHADPLSWLARCGVAPEALLDALSRADLAGPARTRAAQIVQHRDAALARLRQVEQAAADDLARVEAEEGCWRDFEASRDRFPALSAWVDRQASKTKTSPFRALIAELEEQLSRMKADPKGREAISAGKVARDDVFAALEDRYADLAPPTRSRRGETRRASEEDERPAKPAPPTLSNAQASEVATALPVDLDHLPEREANRILSEHARSLGVFRNS